MKFSVEKLMENSKAREKAIKVLISLALAIGFLYLFSPFLGPLLLAIVFAFAIEPTLSSFSQKKVNRLRYGCLFLIFVAIALASAPFALVSVVSYSELNHISSGGLNHSFLYQSFHHTRAVLISALDSISNDLKLRSSLPPTSTVDQAIQHASTYLAAEVPKLVLSIPSFLLAFIVFNTALFLFLFRARSIKAMYLKTHFLRFKELNYVIYSLQSSCRATVVSTIFVGVMHATLFSLGSFIFKLGDPIFIFPITFICSFLPVIGTLPVTLTLIGMSLTHQRPTVAVGFLAIAFLSATLDYWMRVHWMVNESKRIHPALSFIGLLGAIIHFGLAGVIYGPLCISLAAMIIPKFILLKNHAFVPSVKENSPHQVIEEVEMPATIHPLLAKSELTKRPWIN
jgi:predicted PurR-regulated permease PerM